MNATILYTKLSRDVLSLNINCSDDKLKEFMKQDKGFFKLRSLLLCRSCRDLCVEPYSSNFCQHLVCKSCYQGNNTRNPGCKWCRNIEDLMPDMQSKILIGLYKQLCAILRDVVTEFVIFESENQPGCSAPPVGLKEKLLKFIDEGCSLPDVDINIQDSQTKEFNKPQKQKRKYVNKNENKTVSCPPCCCNCGKVNILNQETAKQQTNDITNDPIKITAAQSSHEHKNYNKSPEHSSDPVSSTVPDSVPAKDMPILDESNENKYGTNTKEKEQLNCNENNLQPLKYEKNHVDYKNKKDHKMSSTKFYEKMNSLSRKKRKNKSIFERFGLALTPNGGRSLTNDDVDYTEKLKRKKLHQNSKEKKRKNRDLEQPKVKPLKLTVQKINDQNNDVSYKIQYDVKSEEKNNNESVLNDESMDLDIVPDSSPATMQKSKRKATFISNYAVFSDNDSDFEEVDNKIAKKQKKPPAPKEDREICGCGAGSKVKYFTDICKRSRCPCYSQGRACVNCKCRFCSNPFLLDGELIYSDSSADQPLSHWVKDEYEDVDVEAV